MHKCHIVLAGELAQQFMSTQAIRRRALRIDGGHDADFLRPGGTAPRVEVLREKAKRRRPVHIVNDGAVRLDPRGPADRLKRRRAEQ